MRRDETRREGKGELRQRARERDERFIIRFMIRETKPKSTAEQQLSSATKQQLTALLRLRDQKAAA